MAADVMYDIGEKLSVDHQEPWAYLIGWAVECVMKIVKEDRKWKI